MSENKRLYRPRLDYDEDTIERLKRAADADRRTENHFIAHHTLEAINRVLEEAGEAAQNSSAELAST